MPRIPRFFSETSFFHVMTQGIKKEYIFKETEDAEKYISIFYNTKGEFNVKVIAYCIMGNHAHLLLEVNNVSDLSSFMHKINTKYAIYYNKKYDRVGYVFRDRFKSEGIYTEENLYNCKLYIYNNPVKAGICKYPAEYPFSNCEMNNIDMQETNGGCNFIETYEDKEKQCKSVIDKYISVISNNHEDLLKEQKEIENLIKKLKIDYCIPISIIEKHTGISKYRITNIIRKHEERKI